MIVRRCPARPALRAVLRGFSERIAEAAQPMALRIPARPHVLLEFYLAEPFRVQPLAGAAETAPPVVAVGPMTRPIQLIGAGAICNFTVHFTPTGLSRLCDAPMAALVDAGLCARDALGAALGDLDERVRSAKDFGARIAAAERWAEAALERARDPDLADQLAALMARTRGRVGVARLAAQVGLSSRQAQRRFIEAVGMSPKMYARVHRFTGALTARQAQPARSWTDIAHQAGYADQAHLVRDFRALAGEAPQDLIAALGSSPAEIAGASDLFKAGLEIAI